MVIIHYNFNVLDKYPTLSMIDVGQGDSLLIKLDHNKGNILIDTGGHLPFKTEDYQIKKKEYSIAIN